jgi:hypothetical protein
VDLNDPALQDTIRKIHDDGKNQNVKDGDFRIVGDTTLAGLSGADDPKANLDQFDAQYRPVIQFFGAGIKAVNGPTMNPKFTSADILNPAKDSGQCKNKSPLGCALDAKPAIVFIVVGRNDIAAKVPLDKFSANLMNAVNATIKRGSIPVLVTITGATKPEDEPKVAQYNTVISSVAKLMKVPLFNLYRAKGENPALINPANGELTVGPNKFTDLSPAGLQFGVNVATLHTLELLDGLKTIVPLP